VDYLEELNINGGAESDAEEMSGAKADVSEDKPNGKSSKVGLPLNLKYNLN